MSISFEEATQAYQQHANSKHLVYEQPSEALSSQSKDDFWLLRNSSNLVALVLPHGRVIATQEDDDELVEKILDSYLDDGVDSLVSFFRYTIDHWNPAFGGSVGSRLRTFMCLDRAMQNVDKDSECLEEHFNGGLLKELCDEYTS